MDIICAKCGKHFSSIEGAREHAGHCKETSHGEPIHWKPDPKSKVTPEEWKKLLEHINTTTNFRDSEGIPRKIKSIEPILTSEICPKCGSRLFYDPELLLWRCKNCKRIYTYDDLKNKESPASKENVEETATSISDVVSDKNEEIPQPTSEQKIKHTRGVSKVVQNLLTALLFVFSLSVIGIGLSLFLGNFIPFWLLFGFSVIFSIEKWHYYYTRKHKNFGKLYRLIINIVILTLLGIIAWSGVKLFNQDFTQNSIFGSLLFIAELVFFIWMWRVISRNSWRWPSMKLTVFCSLCLFVILTFAGVEPFVTYKDKGMDSVISTFDRISVPSEASSNPDPPATISTSEHGVVSSTSTVNKPASSSIQTSSPAPFQPVHTTATTIDAGDPSIIDRGAFSAIDAHAIAAPDSVEESISSLASYLIEPAKNDIEKARAIYRWITQNISYDYSGYLSGIYKSTSASDVLKSRNSVCQGYSNLFESLAKSAGLEVVLISGWAKGISYEVGEPITGRTNHAWNVVDIEGAWYLIDSTWGAGHITGGQFVRDFDDNYFFTPPELYILNHFPENSQWQLLPEPISKTRYSELPFVYSNFFNFGIDFGENDRCVIQAGTKLTLTFSVPSKTYLMVNLYKGNTELSEAFATATKFGNSYTISVTLPAQGEYILSIYARTGDQYGGMYDGIMEYKIISGN